MTKHIVMFRFKGTPEERSTTAQSFKAALDRLPDIIEALDAIEVGININPDEQWDLVLTASAKSMEAVKAYSCHPAHVEAVDAIRNNIEQRACVDFTL